MFYTVVSLTGNISYFEIVESIKNGGSPMYRKKRYPLLIDAHLQQGY